MEIVLQFLLILIAAFVSLIVFIYACGFVIMAAEYIFFKIFDDWFDPYI